MSLPVMKIARAAYASVMADPAAFAAVALPWFAIDYLIRYALPLELFIRYARIDRMMTAAILVAGVFWAGLLFTYAGFVVAWTRWVMLREPPASRFLPQIGPRELRCAGIIAASGAIAMAAVLPVAAASLMLGSVVTVVAAAGSLLIGMRLCLAVPMTALDGSKGLLRASWGLTQGAMLRLLLMTAVVALPAAVLHAVIGLAAPDARASRATLGWYVFGLVHSAITLLGSAVLASAYAFTLSAVSEDSAGAGPARPQQ